jgi:WD40 repeat protein
VQPGLDNRVKTRTRFHWPRIFGYDFFVSFKLGPPPIGAQSYSSDLARRLRERDFTVFFSEEEAPPGEQLDGTLLRALRRSRVLVVIVNEGALIQSTWVRKEVEEFRRRHPRRPVIPVVIDQAIDKFGAQAKASEWLNHDGRIWLDETTLSLQEGIATAAVVDRLAVSHRFIRANTAFRWAVAAIMMALTGLASWASYEAWDANRRFREATALRLAAEGAAMTAAERPGGSVRGLLQILAAGRMVPSAGADEAWQAEFLKFQHQIAIREVRQPIDSLAFSSDGGSIVSGTHDGRIQLWNAQTAEPMGPAWAGHGPISSIAFGPGAARIVSGTPDGSLQQWNLDTRQLLPADPLMPAPWFNWSVAISRDGEWFAWGREMGDVVLWHLAEGKLTAHLADTTGSVGPPLGLSFSADGQRVAYYSNTGAVGVLKSVVIPPETNALVWKAAAGAGSQGFGPMLDFGVRSGVVAFSPDDTVLVSGSTSGQLQWWDAATGRAVSAPLEAHDGGVTALAFSPDGRLVVSGGNDHSVKIWRTDTRTVINRGEAAHTGPVTAIAFGPDSQRFATAALDGTFRIWHTSESTAPGRSVGTDADELSAVGFGSDGEPLVTGALVRNMGDRRSNVFASSPAASRQVERVGQNELWLSDVRTGQRITRLDHNQVPVQNVVFSPDGALLASIADQGLVLLWEAQTGRPLTPLRTDQRGVASLAISRDGTLMATGGFDATVRLWSPTTAMPVGRAITGHTGTVWGVAFSADRKRLVSASEDRTLMIWDVATGALLVGPMNGHEAGVRSVAFSPDGARIVSGGGIPYSAQNEQARVDYALRLWDATTGRPIGRPLVGHRHDVQSVAFGPDGKRIVSASADGTTRVWNAFGAWAEALCAKLPRNPTQAEWREWVSPSIDFVCPCPGLGTEPACVTADAKRADGSNR